MKGFRLSSVFVASSLVAAAGMVALAPSAQASDSVTRCDGEIGEETVSGTLVVPAGEICSLDGTTVKGKVQAGKSAKLKVSNGTLERTVYAAKGAYVDFRDSDLGGNIVANDAVGTYLADSTVKGSVHSLGGGSDQDGSVAILKSQVEKRVNVQRPASSVSVDQSDVGGPVTVDGSHHTHVKGSTLQRSLSVTKTAAGAMICDSKIYGDTRYTNTNRDDTGSEWALQIGGEKPQPVCDSSVFGGNLHISDSSGKVLVSDAIIRKNLSGDGNDPSPRGENNRVYGDTLGQFDNLEEPSTGQKKPANTQNQT